MTGRITRLIDDQQTGLISGDDGVDYAFESASLLGMTFGSLHVGARVTFEPTAATRRAAAVKLVK
jgi:cold shock CspA family protein